MIKEAFNKLMEDVFIKHDGCLIEKIGKEFRALGKTYKTLEEAKQAIDNAGNSIANSLKR